MTEPPYLIIERVVVDREYNPAYGDDRICKCGHSYYRHFDTYEDMAPAGCKYCMCFEFEEETPETKLAREIRDLDEKYAYPV